MRVLLTPAGGVHERAVALHRELFAEAFDGREHELVGDLDTSAYLYVRLRESILYADIIGGPPARSRGRGACGSSAPDGELRVESQLSSAAPARPEAQG